MELIIDLLTFLLSGHTILKNHSVAIVQYLFPTSHAVQRYIVVFLQRNMKTKVVSLKN